MGDYFLQRVEIVETLLEDDQRYCARTDAGHFTIFAYGSSPQDAVANLVVKVSAAKQHPNIRLTWEQRDQLFRSPLIML